jgi:hypothetical protein
MPAQNEVTVGAGSRVAREIAGRNGQVPVEIKARMVGARDVAHFVERVESARKMNHRVLIKVG